MFPVAGKIVSICEKVFTFQTISNQHAQDGCAKVERDAILSWFDYSLKTKEGRKRDMSSVFLWYTRDIGGNPLFA